MTHFDVNTLRGAIGHPMFYSIVAELDPSNAGAWLQMVDVQGTFEAGEGSYMTRGRAYSESMRHTLHWSILFIFEDPQLLARAQASEGGLMGYFVRLHPVAFKANGACNLSLYDMLAVTWNTHTSMYSRQIAGWLIEGGQNEQEYMVARRAADHVRALRRAAGQPIAGDGYTQRSIDPSLLPVGGPPMRRS